MSETSNLGLPFIEASQAQKHVTHNEALNKLDGLVQLAVQSRNLAIPPETPIDGHAYIPALEATDEWVGNELNVAVWQDGVWNFHVPLTGWLAFVVDEMVFVNWNGADWVDQSTAISSLQNLATLGVNATADDTNKLSVSSSAVLFNHDGNNIQAKYNKNAESDSASHLFQTGFSARAEIGLIGDDNFHFKVSPDGSTFHEAIAIDKDSGQVSFPNGAMIERHHETFTDIGGGADWWGTGDELTTSYNSGSSLALGKDRMHFGAMYLSRPLQLLGCFVSLTAASSDAGAVLRTGIYRLGAPNGNNWDIGDRIADFGTLPADNANNKIFTLATPQRLDPGWYVTAWGVSGGSSAASYGRWLTPGMLRYFPYSSGTGSRPRLSGPSVYLYDDGASAEITAGLPETWLKNPVESLSKTNNWVYQCVFPKWRNV